ncbi:tryptophan-rich sensory protein [Streptomyces sp. BSE7F]|uniref:TspO/MBR family protein n=1 Tax=unclassified Streptomyces TaxID=2593676 RepID=UPI000C889990|nr:MULTISPECIES: TspO/MBR family protein [unclassified Streptomyces]MBJ6643296.1 tryptophan-rich sensory protein [Streptomyces sp. BSE7-9]MCA2201121.1 tryptophan-rich sensory protein [Streptomyces sp. SMS_SU21]NEA96047.1 tryptophan-rich sensory protein [Actinospica acidiphila]PWE09829.1 tryptophan-rich sensory protein [Streptomyces sp. BSE7F]
MADLLSEETRGPAERGRPGWPTLVLLLAVCYAVAALGSLAAADSGDTYQALERPSWAPPGWVFGPVWTVLYGTIAVAAWLALRGDGTRVGRRPAMVLWSVQLALNLAWTPLFFAADAYGWAFAEICLLWLALVATVVAFAGRRRAAAVLLLPYAAWVTYAASLNLSIWLLNT